MSANKFMTTPFGSYLKVFLSTILAMYIAEGTDLWSIDLPMLKKFGSAGIASCIPVLYNALNPKYTNYGRKKTL